MPFNDNSSEPDEDFSQSIPAEMDCFEECDDNLEESYVHVDLDHVRAADKVVNRKGGG